MSAPIVSVLITTYNREAYVGAAIESALAQTLGDFELIIVDDGSRDATLDVARRYERDPRVRVHVNERNLGDYANRNAAAGHARGRYLKYVDADDLIYPHCLEVMVSAMEDHPEAGMGLCFGAWRGAVLPRQLSPREAYECHFFGGGLFNVAPLDAILRRERFERAGGFHPARFTGDYELWLRLARDWPVVVLPIGLHWWRHHAGQESEAERASRERLAEADGRRRRVTLEALGHERCPLDARHRRVVARQVRAAAAREAAGHLRHRAPAAARTARQAVCLGVPGMLASLAQAALPQRPVRWAPPREGRPAWLERAPASAVPLAAGHRPAVSVLIPARNAEAAVRDAIRSVLAQRFGDWELVVVDDASDDRTFAVAAEGADGERIRVVRNETRLGKWPSHNRAAELARGEYLVFLHADEMLYPHALEVMLRGMRPWPRADLGISGPVGPFRAGACLEPAVAWQSEFLSTARFLEGPASLVIRREAFVAAGGFDAACEPAERHLQLRLAARRPIVLLPAGLAWHPRWAAGMSMLPQRQTLGRAAGVEWLVPLLREGADVPLSPAEREDAAANVRNTCRRTIRERLRRGRLGSALRLRRQCGLGWLDLLRRPAPWRRAPAAFYERAQREEVLSGAAPVAAPRETAKA